MQVDFINLDAGRGVGCSDHKSNIILSALVIILIALVIIW